MSTGEAAAGKTISLKCSGGELLEVEVSVVQQFRFCDLFVNNGVDGSQELLDEVREIPLKFSKQHVEAIIEFCRKEAEFGERAAERREINAFRWNFWRGHEMQEFRDLIRAAHFLEIPVMFTSLSMIIAYGIRNKSAEYVTTLLGIDQTDTTKIILEHEIAMSILQWMPGSSLASLSRVSKQVSSCICDLNFVKSHTKNMKEIGFHRGLFRKSSLFLTSFTNRDSHSCLSVYSMLFENCQVDIHPLEAVDLNDCRDYCVLGSVNGLLCAVLRGQVHIWNASLGDVFSIFYNYIGSQGFSQFGFGFDHVSDDYKVLEISVFLSTGYIGARVFDMKGNRWRNVGAFGHGVPVRHENAAFAEGCLYFRINSEELIVSFDLSTEKFNTVDLPTAFNENGSYWTLKTLGGRLNLISYPTGSAYCVGWCMQSSEWVKKFKLSMNVPNFLTATASDLPRPLYIFHDRVLWQMKHNFVTCDIKDKWFSFPTPHNSVLNDGPAIEYLDTLVVLPTLGEAVLPSLGEVRENPSPSDHPQKDKKMRLLNVIELWDQCLKKGWPAPCYQVVSVEGFFKARVFVKDMVTESSDQEYVNPSDAKESAAEMMLEVIHETSKH
ncbi:unnamed protein product [Linum tenue]|uniref:Uncharacterized protein n=1 Tax=Linum tenue TaxID=586396 RepID=A0AAV0RQC6_9ROSI|nr:unnamed protein product [Linum tenue]CAI0558712.1 unnamed protein product [Linum tenue]